MGRRVVGETDVFNLPGTDICILRLYRTSPKRSYLKHLVNAEQL
jgi:hypothetical protein